jgi:hypothetical protein
MKNEDYKRNLDKREESLASILYFAGCIKGREEQLRQTIHDLGTRVEKCTGVGGWILGTFIVNCNRFVISMK